MPDPIERGQLFEIGQRLCHALGIDQLQAAGLTDAERQAIALEICRRVEIASKLVAAGRLGSAMAHGTPHQRRQRTIEMQTHADRMASMNPSLSWREIARRVGLAFGLSGRRVRQLCKNPKAGK